MREKALEWWRSMDEQTQREVHSNSIFRRYPFEMFTRSSSKIEMVFKAFTFENGHELNQNKDDE